MKLAIARSMMWDPELLLLDEPTNHLDHLAVKWLQDYIIGLRGKVTLCVVSHDYNFNTEVLTDVVHMINKNFEYFPFGFKEFQEANPEIVAGLPSAEKTINTAAGGPQTAMQALEAQSAKAADKKLMAMEATTFKVRIDCVDVKDPSVTIRTFNQFDLEGKVQCWHDRDLYKYRDVPKEIEGGTLLQGPHNDIPAGTSISVGTTSDSCNCMVHVWHQNGRLTGGWDESLPKERWEANGPGPQWDPPETFKLPGETTMYKKLVRPGNNLILPTTTGKRCIMGILVRRAQWADMPESERGPAPTAEPTTGDDFKSVFAGASANTNSTIGDSSRREKKVVHIEGAKEGTLPIFFPDPGKLQGIRSRKAPVIKMDNVRFTYPGAAEAQLTDATIRLGMGSRCALLGKNGAGKTTLMRILVGELPVDEGAGEVWIHHNLRLAYVAQHSMHHLESCLEASPAAYIQRRFADGIDKELANLEMMKLTDEEEKLRHKKGNIYAIVDRKMKGKTIEYGCVMDSGQPDKVKYIPENNLKAKEPYVMKLKRNHDEEWKARTSGMDQRPTTLQEVCLHLDDFGISGDLARSKIKVPHDCLLSFSEQKHRHFSPKACIIA
eukprot:SAG31_NODE_3464_length_4244_cov_3.817370_3_plen_607_part_00